MAKKGNPNAIKMGTQKVGQDEATKRKSLTKNQFAKLAKSFKVLQQFKKYEPQKKNASVDNIFTLLNPMKKFRWLCTKKSLDNTCVRRHEPTLQ